MPAFTPEPYVPGRDPNNGYMTRDGRPVRILATDARSHYPLIGLVRNSEGSEDLTSWTAEGAVIESPRMKRLDDLCCRPESHERWLVIRRLEESGDYMPWVHFSEEQAREHLRRMDLRHERPVHLRKIVWVDGEEL